MLPASEDAYQVGIEEPSITLQEALSPERTRCSDFACRIVAVHLFHECLDHTYSDHADPDPADVENSVFWKRHRDLDNGLATAFVTLPEGLRCPANIQNHQAVFINLQLHTATICLHRSGAARAKKHGLSSTLLEGTQSRLLPAAREIFIIIAALRLDDAWGRMLVRHGHQVRGNGAVVGVL